MLAQSMRTRTRRGECGPFLLRCSLAVPLPRALEAGNRLWRARAGSSDVAHIRAPLLAGADRRSAAAAFRAVWTGQAPLLVRWPLASGRSCGSAAESASASTSAVGEGGLGPLASGAPLAAARQALERYGRYAANERAWQTAGQQLLKGDPSVATLSLLELKDLVRLLAEEACLTQGSFWEGLADKTQVTLEAASLEDLVEIAGLYARIRAWQLPVFSAVWRRARREMAVHWMRPPALVELLALFARAGAGSRQISGLATQLFNEVEDRLMEEVDDFEVEDCISLLDSMARFRVDKRYILRRLGGERLHAGLLERPAAEVAAVCRAYGELGWRHDTVFRGVAEAVLEEQERRQRVRVLGEPMPRVNYSASDVAAVALAMLRLKLSRGSTQWFRWEDKYRELVEVLLKQLEVDLPSMSAPPLAAAAYVFGRARRGTVALYQAMYARFTQLLESSTDVMEPPHEHLERFLHGVAMMGPERKKELDTEWLMQWLCNNVYTFVLSDFIMVNRHLVLMKCIDEEYLQMLVPFYCDPERMQQLSKTDVQELTNTYNGARIREDDMPDNLGRHFFWALGRRYQKLVVEAMAGRRRPPLRRVG